MPRINRFKHFNKENPTFLDVLVGLIEHEFDVLFDLNTNCLVLIYLRLGPPPFIDEWLRNALDSTEIMDALFAQVRKIRLDRSLIPDETLLIEFTCLDQGNS